MNLLGIETSCDETAAAVVADGRRVRSNVVYSQIARHAAFRGVVPEIAARSHVELLPGLIGRALAEAGLAWEAVDGIAVTRGPGLASSLLVGLAAAKALALALDRPLYPVTHLDGHLHSVFLGDAAPAVGEVCPMLVLLVSGGHTALVRVDGPGRRRLLGRTLDDAAGEALDKGATLMGLGYPGGPAIERAAAGGDGARIRFPRGLEQGGGGTVAGGLPREICFSYSGLKTALRYYVAAHPAAIEPDRLADLAASYQDAVFAGLLGRTERAVERERPASLACVGGVARNAVLRGRLEALAGRRGLRLLLAAPDYCTDNAAMIAGVAGAAGCAPVRDGPMLDTDVDPGLGLDGPEE